MASASMTFKDGGNSNKPPCFVGEHYDFWKIRMKMFLQAQGDDIWKSITNGPHVPMTIVDNVAQHKIEASWDNEDKKKVLHDKKAMNILASALGMDEFFRISN